MYIGDYKLAAVINKKFTTRAFGTGVPTTLAGTPVISIYKDNNTTQTVVGVTLTADFDGVAGLNNINIDTSDSFYASGSIFSMIITTGTVGGVSVVGEVVGEFSIEATSALRPTIAGRTLDVSATGEAGIDLANVGSPTTSLALTGTTIATSQVVASVTGAVGSVTGLTASNLDTTISSRASAANLATVQSDTDDIQTRLPAALVGGRMNSNVAAINNTVVQGVGVLGDKWRPV